MCAYLMLHEYKNVKTTLLESGKRVRIYQLQPGTEIENPDSEERKERIEELSGMLDQVFSYMKMQRVQVDIGPEKMASIILLCLEMEGWNKATNWNTEETIAEINRYFASK